MTARKSILVFCAILLMLSGCAVRPPEFPVRESPLIRVGLLDGAETVDFTASEDFTITDPEGRRLYSGRRGDRWRAEVVQSIPGQAVYRLVACTVQDKGAARGKARDVERAGFRTEIRPVGRSLMAGERVVAANRLYRVYLKEAFETREQAEWFRDRIWDVQHTTVVRLKVKSALGMIRLTHVETGRSIQSMEALGVRGAPVTLLNVPVGRGFHWEHLEDRSYPEAIRFELGLDGQLTVINVIPLETYVQGVVPSEMPEGFPMEALKAQAVAARGKALGGWGVTHQADPYDVCATVHCQVYSGLSRRNSKTDDAATATAGLVMWSDGRICDSIFGAVCGGHTEDVDKAWGGGACSYLVGNFDGPDRLKRYGPLSVEQNAKQWIETSPPAYCNSVLRNVPEAMEYTKKYFRWSVELTQDALRKALSERSIDVGEVLDLIPEERGVSGRIIRLGIVGAEGRTHINGELNIRRALSETTLWSSCFTVSRIMNPDSIPRAFVLKGAGWGHGVGMCQTGAAVMAMSGRSFRDILTHYYRGIEIKRLY